jgi:predicted HAD superfamily Cof-like phosphohydrolase
MMLQIEEAELRQLLNERDHLKKQVSELQSRMTEMVAERREASPRVAVTRFHAKFGYPLRYIPVVPVVDEARFRFARISEEFFEVLEAGYGESVELEQARAAVTTLISGTPRVNLPQLAGELADLEFVVVGGRLDFGIPDANAHAVWAANLAKDPARDGKGKPTKPPGWVKPDHAAILREHGWRGP